MNEIKMIPIGDLMHHPENPRKDLGDLEELTASIKANGVLQNLTVVADLEKCKYLVVIGNRRFEAAKAAGLVELPCVISDMDYKTQVATMLEENMQRQDLTVYEQAEGFQMMMDLGYTEKEIGEKTGFSTKTVKDRLKLTKLNKKNFAKAVNKGATLLDLIEVTKLDSKTDQNKVLEYAGTENFRKEMLDALQAQEFQKNKIRLEPVVKEYMTEMPENERYSNKWERVWNNDFELSGSEEDLRKHIEKVMKQHKDVQWRYCFWKYNSGSIEFFHSKPKQESTPLSEGELSERQKAIRRGKHLRYVQGFWAQAFELRKDWIKNFTPQDKCSLPTMAKLLVKYALSQTRWDGRLPDNHVWNDAYIRDVLGLPEEPVESGRKDPDRKWRKDYFSIYEKMEKKNQVPLARILLTWAVAGGVFWPDDPERGLYETSNGGKYDKDSGRASDLPQLYEFLIDIGYMMSDMEKQLMDGTHECYQEDAGV